MQYATISIDGAVPEFCICKHETIRWPHAYSLLEFAYVVQRERPMTLDFHGLPAFVVPGLHGSGERHWQTAWQRSNPSLRRIQQDHWDVPALPVWSRRVADVLAQAELPAVLVAHSFGCLASVHAALFRDTPIAAALLVAPADPAKFGVDAELASGPLPFPTVLVASSNDPWLSEDRARSWAQLWGAEFVAAGALGHINADSRLGDWSAGAALLQQLVDRIPAARPPTSEFSHLFSLGAR